MHITCQDWEACYPPRYRDILLNEVMPFWMRHALGAADGAINNCLDDEGRLQSTDRFLWSQGRALWTFSMLYQLIEQRQEWVDAAHGIYRYLSTHVHLLAVPEREESLGLAIGRAHMKYARHANRCRRWWGHLWANRFYSTPLDEGHCWAALKYIETNPLRNGMIAAPWEYRWSSARAHVLGDPHPLLTPCPLGLAHRPRPAMGRLAAGARGGGTGGTIARQHLHRLAHRQPRVPRPPRIPPRPPPPSPAGRTKAEGVRKCITGPRISRIWRHYAPGAQCLPFVSWISPQLENGNCWTIDHTCGF